jgi:signal transduction histidine kinase
MASSAPNSRGDLFCRELRPLVKPVAREKESAEPTCAMSRRSWAIRASQQPRATRTLIPSGCARSSETSGSTRNRFSSHEPSSTKRGKGRGDLRQGGRSTPLRRAGDSGGLQATTARTAAVGLIRWSLNSLRELPYERLTSRNLPLSMSHELRTPLNAIIGFSEFLV